jgi:hypothetical protein
MAHIAIIGVINGSAGVPAGSFTTRQLPIVVLQHGMENAINYRHM